MRKLAVRVEGACGIMNVPLSTFNSHLVNNIRTSGVHCISSPFLPIISKLNVIYFGLDRDLCIAATFDVNIVVKHQQPTL